jgi:hypothetical protein
VRDFDDGAAGGGGDAEVVFRDMTMLALAGFMAVVVVLLPHLNPEAAEAEAEGAEPPGNVMVEVRWPDGIDSDVDLWVQAPDDVPVGYSNKGGAFFNLLRDDLGTARDATRTNYEVSYSRGAPAGEYVVNLHLYRNRHRGPVAATVVTSVKTRPQDSARQILAREVTLSREGQELTVYRFSLDGAGALVPGSASDLQRPLRSRGQGRT